MNYNRRANRPDGNVYREMRRQTLRSASSGARAGRRGISMLFVILFVCVAVVVWKFSRG